MKKTVRESLHFRGKYHLLFTMNKKNSKKLYEAIDNFKRNNNEYKIKDMFGYYRRTRQLNELRYIFNSDGANYFDDFVAISPVDNDINKFVKYISLTIFNLSDEYIGLSFLICLDDSFLNQINVHNDNIVLLDNNKWLEYKEKFIDSIEELKLSTFNYIKKYFSFFEENEIISLDEFNFYLNNNNIQSRLLELYGFYDCYHPSNSSSLIIDFKEKRMKKTYYCFIENFWVKNFSYNLLLKQEEFEQNYFIKEEFLISYYIYILSYYYFYKFKSVVKTKKEQLHDFYSNPKEKKYKYFIDINKKVDFIKNHIFIDMIDSYIPNLIDKKHLYLKKLYNDVSIKNEEIEKDYINILNVNNLTSSYQLAALAVILAIVSIIIDLNIISFNFKIFIIILIIIFYIIFNTIF